MPDQQAKAIIALLSQSVRDRFTLTYYDHPRAIDLERRHDFLMVLSIGDLEATVRRFAGPPQQPLPLLVHIDTPEILRQVDYAAFFPGVEIIAIEQAELTAEPDVTLRLELFRHVIELAEARV